MQNIGEEICGEYLNHILECDFVSYNILTPGVQGEIDVVGVNLAKKIVYVCEVAVHTQGLVYVNPVTKKPDDFNRFYSKFVKDINYANKKFDGYEIIPMLWSPIVRNSRPNANYNTISELNRLKKAIQKDYNLELVLFINESYSEALEELKSFTLKRTSEFSSPVMRLFQIEKNLENHLRKVNKSKVQIKAIQQLDN